MWCQVGKDQANRQVPHGAGGWSVGFCQLHLHTHPGDIVREAQRVSMEEDVPLRPAACPGCLAPREGPQGGPSSEGDSYSCVCLVKTLGLTSISVQCSTLKCSEAWRTQAHPTFRLFHPKLARPACQPQPGPPLSLTSPGSSPTWHLPPCTRPHTLPPAEVKAGLVSLLSGQASPKAGWTHRAT